jgi:translation elongation factor aEF-1 beta
VAQKSLDAGNAVVGELTTHAKCVDLWGLNMGKVVVNIKALPKDTSSDVDKTVSEIKSFLSKYGSVYKVEVQPLAFGLTVIMITLVADEEEGTSKIEEAFSSFKEASLSISEVSRAPDF